MLKRFFTNDTEFGCKFETQITIWQKQTLLDLAVQRFLVPTDEEQQSCQYW